MAVGTAESELPKTEDEFLEWLVPQRSELQKDLLVLDRILHRIPDAEGLTPNLRLAGWLLGAGFSLWRAVFIANVPLEPERNTSKAREFLRKVLLDHTIQYKDDKNSWSFGYYTHSATFRLIQASSELPIPERTVELDRLIAETRKSVSGVASDAFTAYENAHAALRILISVLDKRVP
jgi:hypothetical protein